jgi:predicted amidohydrolase YtcJ
MTNGEVFYPDQKLTRQQALETYTVNPAYACFEEDSKGSLAPGKLADVTVFSQDIMTIPEDQILDTEILYTIIGGKILHRKGGSPQASLR